MSWTLIFVGLQLIYIKRQVAKALADEEVASFAELAASAESRVAIADSDFKIRWALITAFGWRFTLV